MPNGMVVLTREDHSIPMIHMQIVYRVGARNERPGITGISHLFEHMMFNGSSKYKPKDFDRLLESAGGYSNAYTSDDVTAYHETFPRDALPLVLDLEADRMASLAITPQNLEQERGIVKEERRLSVDNVPVSLMLEELYAAAYVAHPYQWPVIGWMGDLNAISLDEAQTYFNTYYGPNNATMVVVGDFNTADVIRQIEASFNPIPARGVIKPVVNSEPEQLGERRVVLTREAALPAVVVGFKAPEARHADAPALEVLAQILSSGESSRIFKDLIYTGLAADGGGWYEARVDPSLFTFYLQCQEGHTPAELEKALYTVLDTIVKEGITPEELQKAKNTLRADFVRGMTTLGDKADTLGWFEVKYGDYHHVLKILDLYDAVTAEDIQRMVTTYFVESHRTVVTLVLPQEEVR